MRSIERQGIRQSITIDRKPIVVSRKSTRVLTKQIEEARILEKKETRRYTLQSKTRGKTEHVQDELEQKPVGRTQSRRASRLSRQPDELASSLYPISDSTLSFISFREMLSEESPAPVPRPSSPKSILTSCRATTKNRYTPTYIRSRQAKAVSRKLISPYESTKSFMSVARLAVHYSDSDGPWEDQQSEDLELARTIRKMTAQSTRKPRRVPLQSRAQEAFIVEPIEFRAPSDMGPAPLSRRRTLQILRQPTIKSTQGEVLADSITSADKEAFEPMFRVLDNSNRSPRKIDQSSEVAVPVRKRIAVSREPSRIPNQSPTRLSKGILHDYHIMR